MCPERNGNSMALRPSRGPGRYCSTIVTGLDVGSLDYMDTSHIIEHNAVTVFALREEFWMEKNILVKSCAPRYYG